MVCINGKRGHAYLIPDLRGKVSVLNFEPVSCRLFIHGFYMLR